MNTKAITFPNQHGQMLNARLELPQGPLRATAVFAHCFTCSKDIPAYKRISQRLASRGIAVLRLDFTGHGHSHGEFADSNFSSNVNDLVRAGEFLAQNYEAPQLLIGHSFGGAAVLAAALEMDGIKAIATIGAPDDPSHVTHLFEDQVEEIIVEGEAEVKVEGRAFTIKEHFINDIGMVDLKSKLNKLRTAVLILHSPIDNTVGIKNAGGIFSALKHPKSFVSLDNADHLLQHPEDGEYAAMLIAAWSDRYLDLPFEEPTPKTPEGVVRVSEVEASHLTQDVFVDSRHALIADEPASLGGRNLGPTPYQFVSAGLGACTSMTLRLYARRKKIALDHVYTDVAHDKIYIPEGDGQQRVDQFVRRIHLTGDLSTEDRANLLRIADLCPVHKTLEREAHIVTELYEPTPEPAE